MKKVLSMILALSMMLSLAVILPAQAEITDLLDYQTIANEMETFCYQYSQKAVDLNEADILLQAQPEDLLRFGLIPEFIGRLPVTVALDELSKEALIRIITEPKNALSKQYTKLLEMDGVELVIEEEAIERIAEKALERKTGARGLRSIFEEVMTDIMYEIPSRNDVVKCIITKDTIDKVSKPVLVFAENGEEHRSEPELA